MLPLLKFWIYLNIVALRLINDKACKLNFEFDYVNQASIRKIMSFLFLRDHHSPYLIYEKYGWWIDERIEKCYDEAAMKSRTTHKIQQTEETSRMNRSKA